MVRVVDSCGHYEDRGLSMSSIMSSLIGEWSTTLSSPIGC